MISTKELGSNDINQQFFLGTNNEYSETASSKSKDHKSKKINSLNVTLIDTQAEFLQLKDVWNDLLDKTSEPHPFLSWEWQYTWWETFANKGDQLLIVCICAGDGLLGIAPFYIKNKPLGKVLKLIGEGESKEQAVITHYQDIISDNYHSKHVVATISEYLESIKTWDYAEFSFVLDDSNLMPLVENCNPLLKLNTSLGHRYVLDLKRSFEELYSSLGKSSKKSFRSKKNRLQKEGELTLESLDVTDDIEESLNKHAFFHTHRQQALGRKGNFLEPNFLKFHSALIKRLKGTGKVDIRVLNLDNSPIACSLNYLSNDTENPTVYSYSSGYKSKDDARLSPMFIFDMLEFESLIEKKVAYYDFLSSTDAVSYKDTYRCDMHAVTRVRWFEMTFFGLAAYVLLKARKSLSPAKADAKKIIKKANMLRISTLASLKTFLLITTEKLFAVSECYLGTLCSIA